MTHSNLGEKGLFGLHFHITVHHQRTSGQELQQGRNLEAGAKAEGMEGVLLNGLFTMVYSACFLIKPRTARPRGIPTHNGLGPS